MGERLYRKERNKEEKEGDMERMCTTSSSIRTPPDPLNRSMLSFTKKAEVVGAVIAGANKVSMK